MYSLRMLYAKLRSHQTRLCIGWKRTEWIRNQRRKNNNRATYVGCSSIKIATIKYINVAVDDDDDDAAAVVASAAAVDFVLFEIISRFVYFFKEYLFQSAINKSLCLCSALSSSTHSFVHPSYSTDSHPNGWLILLHIFIDTFLNRLGTNRARIKMHTNSEKAFGVVMWTNNARCMMIETERVRFFSVAFSVRSFFSIHTLSWSFFAFSSMFRSNVHSYFQKTLFILCFTIHLHRDAATRKHAACLCLRVCTRALAMSIDSFASIVQLVAIRSRETVLLFILSVLL